MTAEGPATPDRVLVVDDDVRLRDLLRDYLGGRGMEVVVAASCLEAMGRLDVDLVVLDVMMPGKDGFDVLRDIRARSAVPVIMLTARGEDTDRIVGLELGADDYLAKPFNPRELFARIRAVLRRSVAATSADSAGAVSRASGIQVDPDRREVSVDGALVVLTTTEFDILRTLVENAGRVIPRERLMELARGEEWGAFDRSVDVHVSHLRRKLGDDPKNPVRIKTVRGVGYTIPKAAAG